MRCGPRPFASRGCGRSLLSSVKPSACSRLPSGRRAGAPTAAEGRRGLRPARPLLRRRDDLQRRGGLQRLGHLPVRLLLAFRDHLGRDAHPVGFARGGIPVIEVHHLRPVVGKALLARAVRALEPVPRLDVQPVPVKPDGDLEVADPDRAGGQSSAVPDVSVVSPAAIVQDREICEHRLRPLYRLGGDGGNVFEPPLPPVPVFRQVPVLPDR